VSYLVPTDLNHAFPDVNAQFAPPPLTPGEVYVTCGVDDRDVWPATVDLTDRWNGFLSPLFRPSVARRLARWQARWTGAAETLLDDYQQDQLVLSPDGRTLAHLVWDDAAFDGIPHDDLIWWERRWLTTREHAVWLVYQLVSATNEPDPPDHRVAVGAWHWAWQLHELSGGAP